MSKKILCVVLCILMCLSMLPIGVFAEENPDTAQTEALPEEISEEAPAVEALPEEEEAPEEEALPEEELTEEELTEEASDGAGDQLQGAIPYLVYENGDFQTKWVTDYTLVGNGEWRDLPKYEEVKMEPGCYVFKGKEYTNARIVFTGNTKIILMNDCQMTFASGISVYADSSLAIYGQPIEKDENGEDVAKPGEMFSSGEKLIGAGIGGLLDFDGEGEANVTCGDIYIHGGKLTVIGGDYCAGIGGGGCYKDDYCGNGGNVYIYGGEVDVTGGLHGAGIGGGCGKDESGNGGNVYIYGGIVEATGGRNGAGIGGGTKYEVNEILSNKGVGGSGGYCEINGGTVTATGGEYINMMSRTGSGAGIGGGEWGNGGTVVINGGKVIAKAGYLAAGIGGGNEGAGGKVYLNGGELEVTGDPEAYAIGGGDDNSEEGGVFVGDNVLYVVDLRNGREVISNAPPRGWPYDLSWSWAAFFLMKDYIHVDLVSVESLYVPVEYLKYNEERKHYDLTTNAKTIPILNRGGTLSYWANGWYVVDCDTTISSRVTVNGDVNLILKDGCTLRADNGINVKAGNTLTIYAQSQDPDSMGVLLADARDISNKGLAGIGGGYSNNKGEDCGRITIYGGRVEAFGSNFGAGIGGGGDTMNGYGGNGGTVTVYDGIVKATAGQSAAGIGGGGDGCPGGTLTIYGGDVEAVGSYFGAAVGGSYEGNGGTVNMFDGKLTAIGGDSSTGIGHGEKGTGGTLNFYGGIIDASTADDTNTVDAINSAQITMSPSEAQSARLTTSDGQNDIVYAAKTTADLSGMQNIHLEMTTRQKVPYLAYENGDFVTKECGKYISFFTDRLSTLTGSGDNNGWYVLVGGSTNDRISVSGDVKIILKDGCTFNAENGVLVEEGSSLTIYAQSTTYETKGKLYATSNTDYYAGIGSGPNKASGSIAIHGGYVDAKGGGQAAGIGGGSGRNGTVTIYGGSVYGRGGNSIDPNTESTNFGGGAGIGGGYNGEGTVTIYVGSVYGYGGSEGAAGIGGGCGKKGTVTIYGGSAEGHGGKALADNSRSTPKGGGAGIGGGYNGAGIVKLYGGSAYGYGGVGGAAGIGGGCGSAGSCDILIDGNAYALAYGGTSYISSDIKSGTILNGGSGIGVGDGCTSGTVEIRHARVHAFGGENHNPPYTKAGDGIKATKIIVNPNAGYVIQVSTDDEKETLYSSKTTVDLSGITDVHLLPVERQVVTYLAFNEETGKFESVEADTPIILEQGMTEWTNGTYFATGNVTLSDVTVNGDVILILDNGCTLDVTDVIEVPEGSSLTVYACSENYDEAGTLTVNQTGGASGESDAGIGGGGNVTIHGGNVTATGTAQGAGIGGSYKTVDYKRVEYKGVVTIYGGKITATGGSQAAGIGGGAQGKGTVRIYGGEITATGGKNGGAGIGGGYTGSCDILIAGGDITATGGSGSKSFFSTYQASPGIGRGGDGKGGTVTISGGDIHAVGGKGVKSSNIPDADAIMADQIALNPKENLAIKVTTENGGTETYYPAKTDSAGFTGMPVIHLESVVKTSQMEEETNPTTGYMIIEGANSVWNRDSSTGLVITSDAPFAKFESVKVDGAVIDAYNYTAEEGSTRISLTPAYLQTLSVDTHSFEIVSVDGSASTSFTIKENERPTPTDPTDPQTGDTSYMGLWLIVMLVSSIGFAVCLANSKNKKRIK